MSEENVEAALAAAKVELATMFGNSDENRGVGITGDVYLAELDGPNVILGLRGRFWHQRSTVLARVAHFIKERIPEVVAVDVANEAMLLDN
jgi:hypothetical protein